MGVIDTDLLGLLAHPLRGEQAASDPAEYAPRDSLTARVVPENGPPTLPGPRAGAASRTLLTPDQLATAAVGVVHPQPTFATFCPGKSRHNGRTGHSGERSSRLSSRPGDVAQRT
jgi:hypothetical protein